MMTSTKLKWLVVIQLLLTEQVLCRIPPPSPPSTPRDSLLPGAHMHEEENEIEKRSLLGSQLGFSSIENSAAVSASQQQRIQSAQRVTSVLEARLHSQIQDHLHIQGNVSCEELLSASSVDDLLSSMFPQELLGLSLVPVLVVAGCPVEAQTLILKLYNLLGVAETDDLLMEVETLIESRVKASTPAPASRAPPTEKDQAWRHMEAVMFNIQQLAMVGEGSSMLEGQCEGWTRVNGTILVGTAVEGSTGGLKGAVSSCERLGVLCAGVTSTGPLTPGLYQAVLKKGSRILLSQSTESECWIRECSSLEDVTLSGASGQRMKRSPQRRCTNKSEERVYNVVEWIPAVSTLYNLGTAVYYASVNCSTTAKERAILSAVDLGTDALMVATGGTAGVAGYALGAGVKTSVKAGVKYLLNSMKEEDDVLVNQFSWEEGILTIQ